MASKKLTAELEVDTSKAKPKLARDLSEVAAAAAAAGGADSGAEAGRASRELRDLGERARDAGRSIQGTAKLFAGIGMGMARSALSAGEGSFAGSMAVNAVQAFSMGAGVAGAKGGAAAALASFGITYIESENKESAKREAEAKQKEALLATFKAWEEARARTLAFKETLESLTGAETDLTERQRQLAEEIRKREDADKDLARQMIKNSDDPAAFQRTLAKRNANAAELDQLRALEKQKPTSSGGGASWNGVDALSAVGGMFAGSGAGGRALDDIAASSAETVKVLKEIERNTDNGGAVWQ
jgi:hypothetical protein